MLDKQKHTVETSCLIIKALVTEKFYEFACTKAQVVYEAYHPPDIAKYILESVFTKKTQFVYDFINFICIKGKIMTTNEGLEIARYLNDKELPDLTLKVKST